VIQKYFNNIGIWVFFQNILDKGWTTFNEAPRLCFNGKLPGITPTYGLRIWESAKQTLKKNLDF